MKPRLESISDSMQGVIVLRFNVAEGIHSITRAHVNCYLIEDDEGITVVDAGLPRMWPELSEALEKIGRTSHEVKALILTHGHFDHVCFAVRMQREWQTPVYVHQDDASFAAPPYRYTPQRTRVVYPLFHSRSLPIIGGREAAGALGVNGVLRSSGCCLNDLD